MLPSERVLSQASLSSPLVRLPRSRRNARALSSTGHYASRAARVSSPTSGCRKGSSELPAPAFTGSRTPCSRNLSFQDPGLLAANAASNRNELFFYPFLTGASTPFRKDEGTGAAILAGLASRTFQSVQEALGKLQTGSRFSPEPSMASVYRHRIQEYFTALQSVMSPSRG